AATRAPAGSFVPLGDVSGSTGVSQTPALAVNSGGTAILAWRLAGFSESFIQTAARPPGGSFSAPLSVSNGTDNALFPDVALNGGGAALAGWSGVNGGTQIAGAAVRRAAGPFTAPVAISQSTPDLLHPHLAMDGVGDGTAIWTRNNGTHDIVQAAGYDGSPPK